MRNRCVGLMLAVVALAVAPAAGAEEGPDEAVPEHLTDEYVREKVYRDHYRVPEGFETEPDIVWPARHPIVIRYLKVQDEEGRQVYATADTLAAARELLVELAMRPSGWLSISEELETEQFCQFRPREMPYVGKPPIHGLRPIRYHRVLKSSYLERLDADDSGGVLAETPVTPEAFRRFAEWFWYARFQQSAGAKALASEPGEPRDGKLVHVLYTTILDQGSLGVWRIPGRISLKRTVYTCDPETGEFGIESEVVREIEGRKRVVPPRPPRPPLTVFVQRVDEDGEFIEDEYGRPKEPRERGPTPAKQPLNIPAGVDWYVGPGDDVDMLALAAVMKAKDIPGARLPGRTTDGDLAHFAELTQMRTLVLRNTRVTDAGLAHLRGMTEMRTLWLSGTQVTDAGLEHLRDMTEMRVLYLHGMQVTGAGLEHLRGMTELRWLDLRGTQVTDAGLEHLQGMTELRLLHLQDTQVADAGLEHLRGMTQMRQLGLVRTQVTDAGLEHLKAMTEMRQLSLWGTQVTDAGLEHLRGMTEMRLLGLPREVTDAGLKHLRGMTELQTLNLQETQVTGAGLEHLKGMTEMQFLNLRNTQVTGEGVAELQKALPRLRIHR